MLWKQLSSAKGIIRVHTGNLENMLISFKFLTKSLAKLNLFFYSVTVLNSVYRI